MKKLVLDAFEIAQEKNSNELEEIKAKIWLPFLYQKIKMNEMYFPSKCNRISMRQ